MFYQELIKRGNRLERFSNEVQETLGKSNKSATVFPLKRFLWLDLRILDSTCPKSAIATDKIITPIRTILLSEDFAEVGDSARSPLLDATTTINQNKYLGTICCWIWLTAGLIWRGALLAIRAPPPKRANGKPRRKTASTNGRPRKPPQGPTGTCFHGD